MTKKKRLILASSSPRRKELLGHLPIGFDIITADVEEFVRAKDSVELAKKNALLKTQSVWDQKLPQSSVSEFVVLGADTIVVLEDRILGKPKGIDEARKMLTLLSGRSHTVITAVALVSQHKEDVFAVHSTVEFTVITEDIMQYYLATKESLDKAGAYGIQGQGLIFVKRVVGSYANVVGLPLVEVVEHLKAFVGNSDLRECFI